MSKSRLNSISIHTSNKSLVPGGCCYCWKTGFSLEANFQIPSRLCKHIQLTTSRECSDKAFCVDSSAWQPTARDITWAVIALKGWTVSCWRGIDLIMANIYTVGDGFLSMQASGWFAPQRPTRLHQAHWFWLGKPKGKAVTFYRDYHAIAGVFLNASLSTTVFILP